MAEVQASVTVGFPSGTEEAIVDAFVAGLQLPKDSTVVVNKAAMDSLIVPGDNSPPEPHAPPPESEPES